MNKIDIKPGTIVTLDCCGTQHDLKQYVSTKNRIILLKIVKLTKAGMVQLLVDKKNTISVPPYSISKYEPFDTGFELYGEFFRPDY